MSGSRASIAVLVVLIVAVTACTSAGPRRALRSGRGRCPTGAMGVPEPLPSTSPAVSGVALTLVDSSRPTPARPGRKATPCRVLRTEVRYPTRSTQALPLVVVAHGRDGDPSAIAPLLDAWAAAGYVVAAPTFPKTRTDDRGAVLPVESVDQAHDLTFVIDQLLGRSRSAAGGALRGRIDPRHIGAAGMSLGGLGVYGLISNTCCRDRRVRAAILLAAVRRQFPDDRYEDNEAPVLLVQGDADPGLHNSLDAFPDLAPPKWFITLHGSTHSPPFEIPSGPEAPFVATTTARFWDRYLKGDRAATRAIEEAVRRRGDRVTLRRDLGG